MAIINQLANDDDADDSPSPLATTNTNHCNTTTQQQTTPLPFIMNHITGNTHPIVHHPSSDAPLSNNSIWEFLLGQVRNQLRSMSPSECFIHVRELQEMAHSELLLSRSDDHLNSMSPLHLVGRQHRHRASTGYRNNHNQNTSVSSTSSPMRQQQPAVCSSRAQLALFSPMGRDHTTAPPPVAPSHAAAEDEDEDKDEVSSSPPSKMMLTTADDGDRTSHISEEPLISSVGLKLHRNKDSSSVRQPNIQKKKDTLSPTTTPLPPKKKISSAKKKSATKSSPVKGGSSKAKKGFTLPKTVAKGKKTRAKKKTPTPFPSSSQTGVKSPSDADVLCGRGFVANNHKGNMQFRDYVMQLRCVYQEAQKGDKKALAEVSTLYVHLVSLVLQLICLCFCQLKEVVSLVKIDGGRFLRMSDEDGLWYEVADEAARKKASQGKLQCIYFWFSVKHLLYLLTLIYYIYIYILLTAFREDKW